MSLIHKIHDTLIAKKLTLSLAESCSGGLLAYQFVQMPNCSYYFQGSLVAYSKSAKVHLLGVNEAILNTYGDVSSETAKAMAEGAIKNFHTDIALAITGLAGPSGGSAQKPVGTVFIGLARKNRSTLIEAKLFSGSRQNIIRKSVKAALHCLSEEIQL